MIQFANDNTTPLVRQMWKTCFGDSDEFIDLYFSGKYVQNNTLIYFDEGEAVASLQMLPGTITFYGSEIAYYYMSGLCTLPQARKKGFMAELMYAAHAEMAKRGVPLAILIPAEDWLYDFYRKYGYEQVFAEGDTVIPSLGTIHNQSADMQEAYLRFDAEYRHRDFCVQKSYNDFVVIMKEAEADDFAEKTNLPAMAHIVDVALALQLYAAKNATQNFVIGVDDILYNISAGKCEKMQSGSADISVDIRLLCRLLFGYKLYELDTKYLSYFAEHEPIINLMLE